ncbi:MAG: hypothetical protein NTY16_06185 [Deltaproteobacteria bacterium]|nr:hypothetical protein [Deltaproteobacteria bacterium]
MKVKPVPILVGAAQYTQRKDAHPVVDPLGLMIGASRHALADAGVDGLPAFIDTVCVVNRFSLDDEDAPRMFSHALGVRPREAIYTRIGGNTPPQMLVNQFSRNRGRQAPGSPLEGPGDGQRLVSFETRHRPVRSFRKRRRSWNSYCLFGGLEIGSCGGDNGIFYAAVISEVSLPVVAGLKGRMGRGSLTGRRYEPSGKQFERKTEDQEQSSEPYLRDQFPADAVSRSGQGAR